MESGNNIVVNDNRGILLISTDGNGITQSSFTKNAITEEYDAQEFERPKTKELLNNIDEKSSINSLGNPEQQKFKKRHTVSTRTARTSPSQNNTRKVRRSLSENCSCIQRRSNPYSMIYVQIINNLGTVVVGNGTKIFLTETCEFPKELFNVAANSL